MANDWQIMKLVYSSVANTLTLYSILLMYSAITVLKKKRLEIKLIYIRCPTRAVVHVATARQSKVIDDE